MLGYWNRPEETAQALRGGWLRTGDIGYLDDAGYLYIVDRLKDMIIKAGTNIYSVEVENAIAHHADVAACAVIAVPDDAMGEAVHAVVVPRPGTTVDADGIRAHCAVHLAAHKVPDSVAFVDELPMSPAGKVLKRELRRPYWDAAARQVH